MKLVPAVLMLFFMSLPALAESYSHSKFNLSGFAFSESTEKMTVIPKGQELAALAQCFNTGQETDGMYKICYYDCLGDRVAITIRATKLCPLSIER